MESQITVAPDHNTLNKPNGFIDLVLRKILDSLFVLRRTLNWSSAIILDTVIYLRILIQDESIICLIVLATVISREGKREVNA